MDIFIAVIYPRATGASVEVRFLRFLVHQSRSLYVHPYDVRNNCALRLAVLVAGGTAHRAAATITSTHA